MINPPQSTTAYHISPLTTTILPHTVRDCKNKLPNQTQFPLWTLYNFSFCHLCILHIFLQVFSVLHSPTAQYIVQYCFPPHYILCFHFIFVYPPFPIQKQGGKSWWGRVGESPTFFKNPPLSHHPYTTQERQLRKHTLFLTLVHKKRRATTNICHCSSFLSHTLSHTYSPATEVSLFSW